MEKVLEGLWEAVLNLVIVLALYGGAGLIIGLAIRKPLGQLTRQVVSSTIGAMLKGVADGIRKVTEDIKSKGG